MRLKRITAQIQMNFFVVLLTVLFSAQSLFAAEQVFFYHTDPAGTPLAMTDSTGKVVWKADYKPFGEEQSVTATTNNDRRFVGKEKDTETGLSYFGARYEDAKTGRFISPDPIRAVDPKTSKINEYYLLNPQRLNTYAYGLNNPYRYVDPDGKFVFLIPAVIAGVEYTGGMMLADATFAYLAGKFAQQIYKGSTGKEGDKSKAPKVGGRTNPYEGPVDAPVNIVDPKGNTIPVGKGERLTGSPDGKWVQVRDPQGNPTGTRIDGAHNPAGHPDPRAQQPHAHRPGISNPDGTPWLPVKR